MNFKLVYDQLDVTSEVVEVNWSGELEQPYRTLSVTCQKGKKVEGAFRLGKPLFFYAEEKKHFDGIIFAMDESITTFTLTAYDKNVYLTKNEDSRKFTKVTATQVIQTLCREFSIPVGTLANTAYVFPKLILRDQTLWDMILRALTETSEKTGKKYWVHTKDGKLVLEERLGAVSKVLIEDRINLTEAQMTLSMEEMKNQIKVLREGEKGGESAVIVPDAKLIKDFGLMQKVERVDEKTNMQTKGKEVLKELGKWEDEYTLEARAGDLEAVAGRGIYVHDTRLSIKGSYYITHDAHTFTANSYTMSLTLSQTDDLPKLVYEEESE